ncbi:hypothetical protein JZ751_025939 [Albula glossodonta]|uniref:Uncharacterized protein n=1 Tax=Albula glossodonta TaxID=121402 RepID=A0A8T2MPD7_9TELE|nr:hypothetical protein JZ751_025939 [Albula glossodonta]
MIRVRASVTFESGLSSFWAWRVELSNQDESYSKETWAKRQGWALCVLLLISLLGLAHSHPNPLKLILQQLLDKANRSLAVYNDNTPGILWHGPGPYDVGCIHEPKEDLNISLFRQNLPTFHCYMRMAAKLDLDDLTQEFSKMLQQTSHLMDTMNADRNQKCGERDCTPSFDFGGDEYKQLKFGRDLLVLYTKWLGTILKRLE